MPVTKKPGFDPKAMLMNSLREFGQADADDSPLWASIKGGLSGSAEAATNLLMPGNDDQIPAGIMPPVLGMAGGSRKPLDAFKPKQPLPSDRRMDELVGKFGPKQQKPVTVEPDVPQPPRPKRAAPGYVNGIQGFALPDGRIVTPDVTGVNRIVEGDDALRSLQRMVGPSIRRQNVESAAVPTVSGADELSDVAVPIADSLDTNMAPGAPLMGKWGGASMDPLLKKTAKVSHQDILAIRQLYDGGMRPQEIAAQYPGLSVASVDAIARRHSYPKVK